MTSLDQMLSATGSKIAYMSDEFKKNRDHLPSGDIKMMTEDLKKTKQNLFEVLGRKNLPKFDTHLIASILSCINKIKKTAPEPKAIRRQLYQKSFVNELVELQDVLKVLQMRNKKRVLKEDSVERKPIIKIEGIKRRGKISSDRDLGKHLSLTESKLNDLKKSVAIGKKIPYSQYRELTTLLKRANVSLVKAKAMQKSLKGIYRPNYDKKITKKIFNEIAFFQNILDEVVQVGTSQVQVNLFWFTLREFQTLLKDLESLKKIRGKAVAAVQTDMAR